MDTCSAVQFQVQSEASKMCVHISEFVSRIKRECWQGGGWILISCSLTKGNESIMLLHFEIVYLAFHHQLLCQSGSCEMITIIQIPSACRARNLKESSSTFELPTLCGAATVQLRRNNLKGIPDGLSLNMVYYFHSIDIVPRHALSS